MNKSKISFSIFVLISIVHIVLTNLNGGYFNYSKVLLMPSLAVFFLLTVRDRKHGAPIIWAQTGLWLGNICLIWGESSIFLFFLGSAATVLGFFGYILAMLRNVKKIPVKYIYLQIPLIWICFFFIILMKDELGSMLIPISLYMTLIAFISLTALAQLLSLPRSAGSWIMFAGSLCYIAENGLYTANHYIASLYIGENIVHPCFIAAQSFFAVGYLLLERQKIRDEK